MTHTKYAALLTLAALAMASAADVRAATSYISSDCSQSGAACITITLKAKATFDNGNDSSWSLDRISATMSTSQCVVSSKSGTNTFQGGLEMSVDSGKTILTRMWKVPAHCQYQLHIRHPESWPSKDDIFYHTVDANQTSGDVCLEWDLKKGNTATCQ